MTNAGKPIVGKTEPKKKKFPDGKSISQYGRYKTWTYKRWAWEFLCRNIKFREACDRAAESESLKSKVAKDFGLVKFKNYKDVQTKSNVFPIFKDSAIQTFPNLGKEKLKKLVSIYSGQVFIRFKLKTNVDSIAAIDAQLERARKYLYKLHTQYSQIEGVLAATVNPAISTDSISLVQYLQILDLKAYGIDSAKEIVTYLYGAKAGTKQYENIDNLTRALSRSKKLDIADTYPIEGYRYLALKLGRPD